MRLVGRDRECARIDLLLERACGGRSETLVLCGEAGVGKSSLLRYAVARAGEMQVLSVVGVEAEADMAFSGLLEACRPILAALEEIPPPQAAALRAAFALGPAVAGGRFAVAAGTLSLLAHTAEARALLVIVDDAQWLDPASAEALVFAARRLEADAVALLFGVRDGEGSFEAAGLERLNVGPLDAQAARLLATASAPTPLGPHVLEQLLEAGAGNALALVELAGSLSEAERAGADPLPESLPLAAGLERAFARSLERLAADERDMLLLAAVGVADTLAPIRRAAEPLGLDPQRLEAAEDAGLIRLERGRAVFRHPLLRSAVARQAPPSRRRAAHRALAAAYASGAEQRAWHLAAAATEPDAEAAKLLERIGDQARARSAHASAARAYQRAAELEPSQARQSQLLLAAAQDAWRGGQAGAVLPMLDRALDTTPCDDRGLRADIQHLRGQVLTRLGHLAEARALLIDEASRVVQDDDARAVWMLCDAAEAASYEGNHSAFVEIAARVGNLGVADGGRVELYTNMTLGCAQVVLGHREQARTLFRRYREVHRSNEKLRHDPLALTGASLSYAWLDDYPRAVHLVRLAVEQARRQGDLSWLGYSLYGLAGWEFWTGQWDQAEADADEAARLALEPGQIGDALYALGSVAYVAAGRGRTDECRFAARQASEIATRLGALHELAGGPLGLLLLGCGDPHAAIEALAPVARLDIGQGQHCPAMQVYDLIEAHTRAGDRDAALAGLAAVERRASRPWESAGALRCRGLLTPAPDCYQALDAASQAFDTLSMPFERARTDLCHGELLRRAGQRTDARVQLQHALETFDTLGAAPWSKHTRAELRASGATLRRGPAQHGEQLTPQELQIALHVADGKTNRQVAASLFLSPRTIELHLTRAYRKLGLHSRAELIHHFATQAVPREEPHA